MRFDSNTRNSQRSNFEDFTNFLGMTGSYRKNNQSSWEENSSGMRSLAMVYAEKQAFRSIFDSEIALLNGTIFTELHKPFNRSSCTGKNFGEGC